MNKITQCFTTFHKKFNQLNIFITYNNYRNKMKINVEYRR